MKTLYFLLCGLALFLFSSFSIDEACSYAGSNMSYVQTQTKKALADTDINKARFFTYKAIKTIQNSTKKFDECGCDDAQESIAESLINLKAATRATSLTGSRILLNEALQHTIDAIDALSQHEIHQNAFSSTKFEFHTTVVTELKATEVNTNEIELHKRIDASLLKYKQSIGVVVDSVDCRSAREFANQIFQHCEQQLLKNNLSEGKKYYHLRTKQITANALARISCGTEEAK